MIRQSSLFIRLKGNSRVARSVHSLFNKMRAARCRHYYSRQFKRFIELSGRDSRQAVEGEKDYMKKWWQLATTVEPYSYRHFSAYMGKVSDIVPEDLGRSIIEPILNPLEFRPYCQDKNQYDRYLPLELMPATIARRIGGSVVLGPDYRPLSDERLAELLQPFDRVILKPSYDTTWGRGISVFERTPDSLAFVNPADGTVLSVQTITASGVDVIVQEGISQSPDIARLNPSSVNTIRVATYRSPYNEEVHTLASMMRVGAKGSVVDNAHQGGCCVGIDIANGEIGPYLYDMKGQKLSEFNGIEFDNMSLSVPSWNQVLELAHRVASLVPRCRLLALDIAIRDDGRPVLLEYNVDGFSYWLFMYAGQRPLGRFTDEIIGYCRRQLKL